MGTALIGIMGVVLGVVLSSAGARYLEFIRRRERIQDVSTAIRAEIRSLRRRLQLFRTPAASKLAERILETAARGEDYTPFVPKEPQPVVFEAIVRELHILPTEVIDPIIYFYRQMSVVAQFAEDLRSERFAKLDAARKAEIYRDYLELGTVALDLAEHAINALEQPGASNPASGRSVRQSGSDAEEDGEREP